MNHTVRFYSFSYQFPLSWTLFFSKIAIFKWVSQIVLQNQLNPLKIYKIKSPDVLTGIGHMPSRRFLHDPLFYCLWSPALSKDLLSKISKVPTLTAQIKMLVIVFPRTMTAFEPGSAGHVATEAWTCYSAYDQFPFKRREISFLKIFCGFHQFRHKNWNP